MIQFFLKKHVFSNLITLFVVLIGGYFAVTVRREAFPEINFDWITVTTIFPGASPQEVEKLVTNNIEDQLRSVDGVDKVMSWSLENRSEIAIRVEEDLSQREKDKVFDKVQQAVNRVQDLPEEADEPIVQEITSDRPLITLSVAGGTQEDRDNFADEMADIIEEIPGVSRVDQQGDFKKEIWIEVDRIKLANNRLTLTEVANAVKAYNLDSSAGAAQVQEKEVLIRIMGAAENAENIASIILRGNDARSYLRIRDVAVVTERYEEPKTLIKANGQPSINLNIRKIKSGDTIKLADEVRRLKDEYSARAKNYGISMFLSDDISFFIKRRLKVMTSNLLQGGFLILLALFIFLDWRLALVAAMGVPISFASAFAIAVPLGFTINLMSLLALIIVLGMLDDDSVVVAENIYRHMEMGKTPFQAAVDGTREIVLPVVGAVAVSCCGFIPFALVSGIMGKFLLMIPLVIIVCFLSSLFEAFFILPSHVVSLMPLGKPVEEKSDGRWYTAILKTYRKIMMWVLEHRLKFSVILLVFLVLTGLLAKWRLKFVLFPDGLVDQFFIQVEMPQGMNLQETEKVIQKVEDEIVKLPATELDVVTSMVGFKMTEDESLRYGTHYGQARVYLTPEETRKRKTKEIIGELRDKFSAFNGPAKITFDELQMGPPVGKAVDLKVRGKDMDKIQEIVSRIKTELSSYKGVTDIKDSRDGGKEEVQIILKDTEAGFAGMDTARVAQNILYAIDGGEPSKIRRGTDEITIKVKLQKDQRENPQELLKLDVLNTSGRPVRLGEVAEIKTVPGLPFIEHYNFKPALGVTAGVDKNLITSKEANDRIENWFKDKAPEYPGYEAIFGGEEEETEKSMKSLFRAFGLALFLDYIILASLFASYIQPFIIIFLTVPIGLMGVVYALLLHGKPASFMALLGVVAMTGVVINNAIVLVNFMNTKKEEGMAVKEAAVEAGAVRLRAIWASSITTLLGLFPTAYGFGGYEPFVAPMALSLAWGLTLAMPLTLFLIPMAYVLVFDATNVLTKIWTPIKNKIFGRFIK
jgi:multidrug efflux pump subunit AcrB